MGKNYSYYGEKIANVSTVELLKNVRSLLHWFEKDDSIEAAEKYLQSYFQSKIDAHFEADRLMFLNLPDELQNRIDDETYQIVNNAYVDAFMQGYLFGIKDMQEFTLVLPEGLTLYGNFGIQEQIKTQLEEDERKESLSKSKDDIPF